MSRKGGYQIIDLQGKSSGTIKGIYEKIEGNYYKDLKISGIVIGGVDKNDVYAKAVAGTNEYYIYVYDVLYVIKNDDTIALRTGKSASGISHSSGAFTLTDDMNVLLDEKGIYEICFEYSNSYKGVIVADGSLSAIVTENGGGDIVFAECSLSEGKIYVDDLSDGTLATDLKLMSIRKIA